VVNVTAVHETKVMYRPKKVRWIAALSAVAVTALFTVISFGLHGTTGFDDSGHFERGDQSAMIGLGVLIGLGFLAFTRPRVWAGPEGIRIRNVVGGYDLPWVVVKAVRFDRNSPWATLDLEDDEQVSIHALQAADKMYAVEGVRALRGLLTASQQA
jgi:hypothetical protein